MSHEDTRELDDPTEAEVAVATKRFFNKLVMDYPDRAAIRHALEEFVRDRRHRPAAPPKPGPAASEEVNQCRSDPR